MHLTEQVSKIIMFFRQQEPTILIPLKDRYSVRHILYNGLTARIKSHPAPDVAAHRSVDPVDPIDPRQAILHMQRDQGTNCMGVETLGWLPRMLEAKKDAGRRWRRCM